MTTKNNKLGNNDILLDRPSSIFCNRWMDGTPLGTGATGVVFYGGVSREHLILNRGDLYHNGKDAPVPDVSASLKTMRALQAQGKYEEALRIMYNALVEQKYATTLADMRVLGEVMLTFHCNGIYSDYSRILHLDTAEAEVLYKVDNVFYRRRYFASRPRDIIAMKMECDNQMSFELSSGFFKSYEGGREEEAYKADSENARHFVSKDCYVYASKNVNDDKYFGIAVRVDTDGEKSITEHGIMVLHARYACVFVKAFSSCENLDIAIQENVSALTEYTGDYDALYEENLPYYQKYYNTADIKLYDGDFHSNEAILLNSKKTQLTPELAEKLWRFGRYLFISGTGVDALPFPLYGLWCCGYQRPFTHHVANENVQSIYWHTDVGGLSELNIPLIDYYYKNLEKYRENARQLYGCRGIFVGTYTTPQNAAVAWWVPVILHFVGVAGWLSSHFYRYYKFSGNEELFEKKILPFMLESALFYEDYHYYDDGVFTLYPAVSPENTPLEYYDNQKPHPMPVTKNPTIEIAILKELLTNLLEIAKTRVDLKDKVSIWEKMLSALPEYRTNNDGAIAEWIDENLSDDYEHRHVSHLYPVFPSTEMEDFGDKSLLPAFKRALDLREKGSFWGWSMPHMSAIYSRMKQSEDAYSILNGLCKVCLLDNFFTLGYDYRDMGVTGYDCGEENATTVQFDALLGHVNALQEMLLFASKTKVKLLPACPKAFSKGEAKLNFITGYVKFAWDASKMQCCGEIIATRDTDLLFEFPFGRETRRVQLQAGGCYRF